MKIKERIINMSEFDTRCLRNVIRKDKKIIFPACQAAKLVQDKNNLDTDIKALEYDYDTEISFSITESQFNENSLRVQIELKNKSGDAYTYYFDSFELRKMVRAIEKINRINRQRFIYESDRRETLFDRLLISNAAEQIIHPENFLQK